MGRKCAWWDVICHAQNFGDAVGSAVGGIVNAVGGAVHGVGKALGLVHDNKKKVEKNKEKIDLVNRLISIEKEISNAPYIPRSVKSNLLFAPEHVRRQVYMKETVDHLKQRLKKRQQVIKQYAHKVSSPARELEKFVQQKKKIGLPYRRVEEPRLDVYRQDVLRDGESLIGQIVADRKEIAKQIIAQNRDKLKEMEQAHKRVMTAVNKQDQNKIAQRSLQQLPVSVAGGNWFTENLNLILIGAGAVVVLIIILLVLRR